MMGKAIIAPDFPESGLLFGQVPTAPESSAFPTLLMFALPMTKADQREAEEGGLPLVALEDLQCRPQ